MKSYISRSVENIVAAVLVFLMALMFCALIDLLEGCTTHRHVTATTATDSVATAVHTEAKETTISQSSTVAGHFVADSLWASLTADSVVTPTGAIIYRPVFTAGATRPQCDAASAASATATVATAATDSAHTQASAATASESDTGATAIAKPPDTAMWWVIALATLAALLIGAWRWRKN